MRIYKRRCERLQKWMRMRLGTESDVELFMFVSSRVLTAWFSSIPLAMARCSLSAGGLMTARKLRSKIARSREKKAFRMNAGIHPPADDTTRHTSQHKRLMKGTLKRIGWNDLLGGVVFYACSFNTIPPGILIRCDKTAFATALGTWL